MERDRDWLTTLVDGFYLEKEGYIDGDVTKSTFLVPFSYQSALTHYLIDVEIQYLLTTQILTKQFFTSPAQHSVTDNGSVNANAPSNSPPSSPNSSSPNSSELSRTLSSQNIIQVQNKYQKSVLYDKRIELYVLKTRGDGDCLLHAISLSIWGKEDQQHYLRNILSLTLSEATFQEKLLPYWCEEELHRDVLLGFSNARDLNEIKKEFLQSANIAHERGRYLEGIHITCLANIFRRPIVCYSQDISGKTDNDMSGQSLAGVYLPILHHPKDCCRIPLVIVYSLLGGTISEEDGQETKSNTQHEHISYHSGHFSAVVGIDYQSSTHFKSNVDNSFAEGATGIGCYPLVGADLRVLPPRYCYPYDSEANTSSRKTQKREELFRSYLDIHNFSYLSDDSNATVRSIPVVLSRSLDELGDNRGISSKVISSSGTKNNFLMGSVAVKSKRLFFSNILDAKRNQLEQLRAKMRKMELQISQIQDDIRDSEEEEVTIRRQERSSLNDYQIMKREQQRTDELRRRSEEKERKKIIKETPQSDALVPRLNGNKIEAEVQDSPSSSHRSSNDRAGTPKRVFPSTRSQNKDDSLTVTSISNGSSRKEAKHVPSEERKEYWRRLGLEYYNGELMSIQEASELKNALKISLQNSAESVDESTDDHSEHSQSRENPAPSSAAAALSSSASVSSATAGILSPEYRSNCDSRSKLFPSSPHSSELSALSFETSFRLERERERARSAQRIASHASQPSFPYDRPERINLSRPSSSTASYPASTTTPSFSSSYSTPSYTPTGRYSSTPRSNRWKP